MKTFDTIVIGGGHNGLICAAYLAKSGQSVLLLEANEQLGGLAATTDFHPGFKASVAHSIGQFPDKIVKDLNLTSHGYTLGTAIPTVGLSKDGNHVSVLGDVATGVSEKDATSYKKYRKMMLKYMSVLKPFSLTTIPGVAARGLSDLMTFAKMGIKLKLLGQADMREFMRVVTLPARDIMDENFDSPALKGMLSWDGLVGSKMAPRSPNHTILNMLYRMIGENGGDHAVPDGGVAGLVSALASAAEALGVEIRTGAAVDQITIEGCENGLKATGVFLKDGEMISAECVVSAADPQRTFFDMVGVDNLEIQFTNRIRRLRCEGFVAKLHLALSDLPSFTGLDLPKGRMIIAPTMDSIEFAFDDAKYGDSSKEPVMEILIPSIDDDTIAPNGQHVLSAHVMYIPHDVNGGWNGANKAALTEQLIDTIAEYAPNIRSKILHAEVLTPADIATTSNVTGGHWHHTEFALDQLMMMRPTYQAAQYSTPIPGLYLASAGCHPGGGLMGGPGHNAAHEILK